MPPTRAWLIEQLDAHGSAPVDAALRLAVLRAAGIDADAVLLAAADDDVSSGDGGSFRPLARYRADAAGHQALTERVRAERPAAIYWAAASPNGAFARLADREPSLLWWPAGSGTPPRIARSLAVDGVPWTWTPVDIGRLARPRLSLWDGAYVLAGMPLAGRAGSRLLEAFADVADGADALDLVVLAHAQGEFEAIASRLGIGPRVHFAGPAPREAEVAWLQSARAVLFAGDAPLSSGLPLRALACGAPVLALGEPLRALADWLRSRGVFEPAEDVRVALAEALTRTPAARARAERGRAVAAELTPEAIGARLATRRAPHARADRNAA